MKVNDCEDINAERMKEIKVWGINSNINIIILIVYSMVKVNILADALKTIVNAERKGQKQVLLRPVSKVLIKFLRIMQKHQYIGEFEIIDDHRSKKIVIELIGRINKCGVISPRYDILLPEFEKWTSNILPSRQFGHLILSTTQGIFTHEECRERHIGGKIIGFFY
jgi:small subunit ribosomal protein S15Ae